MNRRCTEAALRVVGALVLTMTAHQVSAQVAPLADRPPLPAVSTTPQPRPPRPARTTKWEIEFHGGGVFSSQPSGGSGTLPAAGATFTAPNGAATRAVSSWYVGDGAALFNENAAFRTRISRIAPLDTMLTSASAKRRAGASVGVRVGRPLTPRFGVEFGLDFNLAPLAMSDDALDQIEVSRESFSTAFTEMFLLSTIALTGPAVTSTATLQEKQGTQIVATGALNIRLTSGGRFIPYATVGAGIVSSRGDGPSADLVGNYRFVVAANGLPVNETDTVRIRYDSGASAVVVVGGGFKRDLSERSGWRGDVRLLIGSDKTTTLLDATPGRQTVSPGTAITFGGVPALQVSGSSVFRSSLSGTSLTSFETFKGSGTRMQAAVTFGYYRRF